MSFGKDREMLTAQAAAWRVRADRLEVSGSPGSEEAVASRERPGEALRQKLGRLMQSLRPTGQAGTKADDREER